MLPTRDIMTRYVDEAADAISEPVGEMVTKGPKELSEVFQIRQPPTPLPRPQCPCYPAAITTETLLVCRFGGFEARRVPFINSRERSL
jgi:hypothetical protein